MDNPLVQVDPGLYIWTIVTFVVLVAALARYAWKPLLKALEGRQETIRKSLEDADQAKHELERLQSESAEMVRKARIEAEAIISRSRSDGEVVREELRTKARTDADKILSEARRQIEMEKNQALRDIRNEVADLSILVASKLLERNISKEDNEKLVADALEEIADR